VQRPDELAAQDGGVALVYDAWGESPIDVFLALRPPLGGRIRVVVRHSDDANTTLAALNGFFSRLSAAVDGCNWVALSQLVDVPSMAASFLGTELSNDPDAYAKSTYLVMHHLAKSDAILAAGPLWDKNLGYGGDSRSIVSGWRALASCTGAGCDVLDNSLTVFGALARCSPFMKAAATAWRTARSAGLADAALAAWLHQQADRLTSTGAVERDARRWRRGSDFGRELAALQAWLQRRAAWIDEHLRAEK